MDDVLLNSETMNLIYELKKFLKEEEIISTAINRFMHEKEIELKFNFLKFGSTETSPDAIINLPNGRL